MSRAPVYSDTLLLQRLNTRSPEWHAIYVFIALPGAANGGGGVKNPYSPTTTRSLLYGRGRCRCCSWSMRRVATQGVRPLKVVRGGTVVVPETVIGTDRVAGDGGGGRRDDDDDGGVVRQSGSIDRTPVDGGGAGVTTSAVGLGRPVCGVHPADVGGRANDDDDDVDDTKAEHPVRQSAARDEDGAGLGCCSGRPRVDVCLYIYTRVLRGAARRTTARCSSAHERYATRRLPKCRPTGILSARPGMSPPPPPRPRVSDSACARARSRVAGRPRGARPSLFSRAPR